MGCLGGNGGPREEEEGGRRKKEWCGAGRQTMDGGWMVDVMNDGVGCV
jgi:hypothetical protein